VVRDHASEAELRVFVLGVLAAEERRSFLRRKRAKKADPEPEPVMVPTTRATVIRGHPVGEEEARAWLEGAAGLVEPELAIVNRILHLHRVATADPHVREAALEQALRGGLAEEAAADVERVLGRIEAALRARTAAGL